MIIDITTRGARSEPGVDNTDAIQRAMDYAGAGDTVYVPGGIAREFFVDATRGVALRSGTSLKLDGDLVALPNDRVNSIVVVLREVLGVSVMGPGKIVGEGKRHLVKTPGRAGFCLAVLDAAGVKVGGGLELREGWGDGLYVQGAKNMTVDGVRCVENARNGASIIAAETLSIVNSLFALTRSESPMPQAGIDIEPDLPEQSLLDIWISGNQFVKNKGAGCYAAFAPAANRRRIFCVENGFDQHYKDGSGPPIGGRNTPGANFWYAMARWVPGYDYWFFPTSFTA